VAIPHLLFDAKTPAEQDDHFDEGDGGVDGVPDKGAWHRPARVAGIQAAGNHGVQLDGLTDDQGDTGGEDHDRAGATSTPATGGAVNISTIQRQLNSVTADISPKRTLPGRNTQDRQPGMLSINDTTS
jgi:hypothetical protein